MLRKLPRWCQENSLFPLLTEVSLLKTRFSLSQLNLNDGNDSLQMPCSRSPSRCSTRFPRGLSGGCPGMPRDLDCRSQVRQAGGTRVTILLPRESGAAA